MYSDDDINSAVLAGAITPEAASALRAHVAALRAAPVADEEHFRLVTGFNDIFVVVAGVLLLAALQWIGSAVELALGGLLVAVAAWLLAEFFVRRRRMALPAIVFLGAFVHGVLASALSVLGLFVSGGMTEATFLPAGLVVAAFSYLHWRRFRVPITVAAAVAVVVACVIFTLAAYLSWSRQYLSEMLFVAGVIVFGLALAWDASDRQRQSRRSDVAFWLHLLAAPMLVHPAFVALGMLDPNIGMELSRTVWVLLLYVLIALVSLWIDRRALMVSALGYVLYAFTALLKQSGMVSLSFAITALVAGSALLMLSAFWQKARAAALRILPSRLGAYLPPAAASSTPV